MTRRKDIFWGLYAVLVPYIFLHGTAYITWMLNEYRSRTYNAAGPMMGIFAMAILMGVVLAFLGMHYLSKPIETSRIPLVGLIIGSIYLVLACLYWPFLFFGGINAEILYKLLPVGGRETQMHMFLVYMFLGFYVFLLIFYLKTHTFMPKEELMKEIEGNTEK